MAVYKSIYCYPFAENANLACVFPYYDTSGNRVSGEPFYFSCRVDSSNKDVIGYSIKIYDDAGKVVFPVGGGDGYVSPVDKLPKFEDDPSINSGMNGTYLKIPFFQDYRTVGDRLEYEGSYNALYCNKTEYYTDYFQVDLIICHSVPDPVSGERMAMMGWDNCDNWTVSGDSLIPNVMNGEIWDGKINGVTVTSDHVIACYVQRYSRYECHLYRLSDNHAHLSRISDPDLSFVYPYDDPETADWSQDGTYRTGDICRFDQALYICLDGESATAAGTPPNISSDWMLLTWAMLTHACFVRYGLYTGVYELQPGYEGYDIKKLRGFWFPVTGGTPIQYFLMDGSSYSWEITLYQGPETDVVAGLKVLEDNTAANLSKFDYVYRLDISKIPGVWFDMSLGRGKILGSNRSRLQLSDFSERLLPGEGMSGFAGLLNRYANLVSFVNIGYMNPNYENASEWETGHNYVSGDYCRYYGALYLCTANSRDVPPVSSPSWELQSSALRDYSMSSIAVDLILGQFTLNSSDHVAGLPGAVDGTSIPVTSFDRSLGHAYLSSDATFTDQEFAEIPNLPMWYSGRLAGQYTNGVVFYPHSSNPEDLYNRDTVDYAIQTSVDMDHEIYGSADGDIVLLLGQDSSKNNGIYIYHSSSPHFTRSGAYNTWASYIGRIILDKRSGINYANTAEAGGTLGSTDLFFFPESPLELFDISKFVDCGKATLVNVGQDMVNSYRNDYLYGRTAVDHNNVALSDGLYIAYSYKSGTTSTGIPWHSYIVVSAIVTGGKWKALDDDIRFNNAWKYYCTPESWYSYRFSAAGKKTLALPILFQTMSGTGNISSDEQMVNIIIRKSQVFMGNRVAKLLKNTEYRTFISPNQSLTVENRINFLGNAFTMSADNAKVNTLRVAGLNTKFWWIENSPVLSDETEYTDENELFLIKKWVLKSYEDEISGSPFSYTILSCGTVGNECSFTDYSLPMISLEGAEGGSVRSSSSAWNAIGYYYQGQARSWETYRFTLTDMDDNILQDTGEKYDKKMNTWFLGLDSNSEYYVSLTVTDDLGYRLNMKWPLFTETHIIPKSYGEAVTGSISFNASLDCSTHSVVLKYNGDVPDFEDGRLSIYRREVGIYKRIDCDGSEITGEWRGEWHPVAIDYPVSIAGVDTSIRDFNVKQGHAYEYAIFPKDLAYDKLYATPYYYDDFTVPSSEEPGAQAVDFTLSDDRIFTTVSGSQPLAVHWDEWSIVELEEEDNRIWVGDDFTEVPAIKKKYRVVPESIWLLKFNAEVGSEERNITRGESQTMGKYDRIGYSKRNFASGSVSCYLGSEIAPLSANGYVERLRNSYARETSFSIHSPSTSNEAVQMLNAWKLFAQSSKPKLLTDRKGQKWIVQITSSNITPQESYVGLPSKISFSWKEISECGDDIIIYGDGADLVAPGKKPEWRPVYKNARN